MPEATCSRAGVAFEPGMTGCPVLVGAVASFDCWLEASVPAGRQVRALCADRYVGLHRQTFAAIGLLANPTASALPVEAGKRLHGPADAPISVPESVHGTLGPSDRVIRGGRM